MFISHFCYISWHSSVLQADLDEQANELKAAEDHAKKVMSDASRLAEDLRQTKDLAAHLEKTRRSQESRLKELQAHLDEAEATAMQGGRKMIQKMEQRIHELEMELENEQHRHSDTVKTMQRQERRLKELAGQIDEERKCNDKVGEVIERLHQKLKNYKRQVEESVCDCFICLVSHTCECYNY